MSVTSITLEDVPKLSGRAEDQGWKQYGRCGGMDAAIFFPDRGADVRPAKKVCVLCPVRMACLAYALRNSERLGIWGGLTERERRRLRRGLPLSVTCVYCHRSVKAGGLKQQTCNRKECKERWARGDEPEVVGEEVESEDLLDIEQAEVAEFRRVLPAWVVHVEAEQLVLFPAPPGMVIPIRRHRPEREDHPSNEVEQLSLDLIVVALAA